MSVTVSTVIPVFRGASFLPALVAAIDAERVVWERDDIPVQLLECIFVDDGSTDGSAEILTDLATRYPWIQVVSLGRNFGQHPATIAGALHTSGDWVVTLDEDLQHSPRHILKMLCAAIRERADLVYARPDAPVHQSWARNWSSRALKLILAYVTGNPHLKLFNSYRLVRGAIARAASAVSVHDTYFDMLLTWFTTRVSAVDITLRDERHRGTGQSGYTYRRLLSHARRLIMSSRINYPRVGAVIGLIGILIGGTLGDLYADPLLLFPQVYRFTGVGLIVLVHYVFWRFVCVAQWDSVRVFLHFVVSDSGQAYFLCGRSFRR